MAYQGSQKLAILLCKFTDTQNSEPQPRAFFDDLFVQRGTGGLNDYWRDASLQHIDLDGSEVFGWVVLNQTRNDFITSRPGRWDKIQGALSAFPALDLSKYAGVIAIFNVGVGDAGTQDGVLAGPADLNVTFLAHETGHLFGLAHSFDQSTRQKATWSAPGEYYDPHDIMSAMAVYSSAGSRFSPAGPLLNTPGLDRLGWLDSQRVWTLPNAGSSQIYQCDLVSLGHPEIPGYLAAQIGGIYVEFRTPDRWDAGLPRAGVLFHELQGANPIVLAADKTRYVNDWQPGQVFGPAEPEWLLFGGTRIKIESFDLAAKKARLTIIHRAAAPLQAGAGQLLGGAASDGGGWMILPSGKVVRVPPRSPILRILQQLALVVEAETVLSPVARREVRRTIYTEVQQVLQRALQASTGQSRGHR